MTAALDRLNPTDVRDCFHLIDGARAYSDQIYERMSPATGELIARVPIATAADVDRAVGSARRAFDAGVWSLASSVERSSVLLRAADLIDENRDRLALMEASEVGKPITTAEGDLMGVAVVIRHAAGLAMQMHGEVYSSAGPNFVGLVLREPIGVVGVVTPWNFPAALMSQKVPFALAAGCTVVLKPSEFASSTSCEIAELFRDAGLPDGVFNVVCGDRTTGHELVNHVDVDMVSFTGSTATGRSIVAASAATLKKVSLELGGKAASLVFPDADLEDVVEGVAHGAFFNNGECCVAQSRLLVHRDVRAELVERLSDYCAKMVVGDPLDRATHIGPMIHRDHQMSVRGHVDGALRAGARRALAEREVPTHLEAGAYVMPEILDAVDPAFDIFRTEVFGPVLTVTEFSSTDEAIALANAVDYGLSNSVWSQRTDLVLGVSRALRSGAVFVNTAIDATPSMPFGGYKMSGIGRELGQTGFDEFTEVKSVSIRTGKRAGSFPMKL